MTPLEATNLFGDLSPEESEALRRVTQARAYSAGQVIFREGDPGDGIFIVRRGWVEIGALVNQDQRRVLGRIAPGDFFGEMAVLDDEPRSATATADGPVELSFVPRAELLLLLNSSPRLATSLMRAISRRMREFNRRYVQELIQAERLALVGRFARTIVHDFKNPLAIIGLAAEVLKAETPAPGDVQTAKTRIAKQVDRLTAMTNELLEFTRGAQTPLLRTPVNYASFLAQLLDDLRPEAEARSVQLVCGTPPPAVTLSLDPHRLAHVFHNLIHNAQDAMPGGGRITLRFALNDRELTTEVADTGPGIAPEMAGRLFEPFATFGKSQGSGLGLSICKRIVDDHGGRIAARTEPGGGAVFTVTLPVPA